MQNPAEPFFKTPPPPPNTHFLCKILLPETEKQSGTFPAWLPHLPHPFRCNHGVTGPPPKPASLAWCQGAGPGQLGAKHPQTCLRGGGTSRGRVGPRGAKHRRPPRAATPPVDLPAPPGAPMGGHQLAPQGHGDPLAPRPLSPRCTLSHAHPVIDVAVLCSNL